MTPRDLLLAGLDRYPQHELDCGYHDQCRVEGEVFDQDDGCTCGLAQWRAQVIELIEQAEGATSISWDAQGRRLVNGQLAPEESR